MIGQQINIFELSKPQYKITKPIRLIELFAGIGSQAKALENLNANFENYQVIEFDKYAIASYNAIHGTNLTTQDIMQISGSDLGIVDTDKYEYILTYSFPCQDLSLAGRQKGMAKGDNTRSGLLWEVERLLDECKELPQILLMENVPQVISQANISDFQKWQYKLEQLGYSNYVQLLNAKDYGIPQNRNRCFMVSILGDFYYGFPRKQKLKLRLKDMLEDEVEEKYYLSDKMINFITKTNEKYTGNNGPSYVNKTIANCITTREGNTRADASSYICGELPVQFDLKHLISEPKCIQVGNMEGGKWNKINESARRVYSEEGLRTFKDDAIGTLRTKDAGGDKVVVSHPPLRIRKLTPKECWRLMGFSDEDFEKASKVNSNAQLYKQVGNSIVVNVLEAIFKELL